MGYSSIGTTDSSICATSQDAVSPVYKRSKRLHCRPSGHEVGFKNLKGLVREAAKSCTVLQALARCWLVQRSKNPPGLLLAREAGRRRDGSRQGPSGEIRIANLVGHDAYMILNHATVREL